LVLHLATQSAVAEVNYVVIDLNAAGLIYSQAAGASGGVAVGWGSWVLDDPGHAILWAVTAGSVVDLNPAGFIEGSAYGVSGDAQVGGGSTATGESHALLWRGTAASVLDLHPAGFSSSFAYGVSGDVQVGYGYTASGADHALLWRGTADSVIDLQLIPGVGTVTSSAFAVDEDGNVVGSGTSLLTEETPQALLWWATGPLSLPTITIGPQGPPGPNVSLDAQKSLNVTGTLAIAPDSSLRLEGAGVNAGVFLVEAGGTVSGHGTVSGPVYGEGLSRISAEGGDLVLGDAGRYDGFSHQGTLSVGGNTVTLRTKGFASLGLLTELAGGTLNSQSGFALGPGSNLVGRGSVVGRLAATFGSTIEATGNLGLGDAGAYDGFFSDGSLVVGANTVTIYDRNEAVLGSLTQLGGGNLVAGSAGAGDGYAHFLLAQGKNMVGRGTVEGNFKNHGHVIGDGTMLAERIVFDSPWTVTGKGTFTNTLILGTFAPGESPAITTGTNQGFGGTVQIELGGTVPGFGDNNHDQIKDTGTILLFGSPTLEVLPWNSFVPNVGDQFVVMTWQTGLDGKFGTVDTDPWFASHGISFDLHYNNVGGPGNLTVEALPEPATLSLLALGGALALLRRRSASS
jgi:hypothetical protein